MLKGKAKRSLAFVLAACMLLALLPSFGAGASAASVSYTEVDPSVIDADAAVLPEAEQDAEQDVPAADEEVHVIILFEQKSLAKKGFSTKDLLENEKAASYSSSLKKQQLSLVDRIEREALGGEELEIRYQFTVAVNGVATVVPYGRIEQILFNRHFGRILAVYKDVIGLFAGTVADIIEIDGERGKAAACTLAFFTTDDRYACRTGNSVDNGLVAGYTLSVGT